MENRGSMGDDRVKVRISGWMLVLFVAALGFSGCTGSKVAKEDSAAQAQAALRPAMSRTLEALEQVAARAGAGDAAGAREAYKEFSAAFGEVLGPVSLKDAKLAQRMANANTAIKRNLAESQIDGALIAREAATVTATMQESAEALGIPLVARASAQVGTAPAAEGKSKTLVVRAREYRFTPDQVEVEKGTRLTVRLINDGTMKHEWELDAYGVEIKPIPPGTSQEVTFTVDKAGTFEWACRVDEHDEKGMRGLLVVK